MRIIAAYFVSHAMTVVGTIASFAVMVRLFASRRTPQSIVAWFLGLVFMPFVAIPLYLALGRRKFPRRAKGPRLSTTRGAPDAEDGRADWPIAEVLRGGGVAPPRRGNAFELLTTGEGAYTRLMRLIADSERSIDLTMFILGNDETGRAVVDALVARAARGIALRVILDAVGSRRSLRRAERALGAVGAEVRAFMPLRHSLVAGRTNLRSHRKLAVFDGTHVFAGGMNIATEYMGPGSSSTSLPRWRDLAAVASGRVAEDAAALFESDWAFCGGSKASPAARDPSEPSVAHGEAVLQVVPSGPDMVTDTVYDLFLTGIFGARDRIAIVTPYYVPDDLLQHALVLASRRGVRIDLVVPARSNHRITDFARRNLLRELRVAGVRLHYYDRGMVHAKAMVIDASFAYVGSPNFDMRSLFLNYENALCAYSPDAISQIRSFIDDLISECVTKMPPQREHLIAEQLARMLAPEL